MTDYYFSPKQGFGIKTGAFAVALVQLPSSIGLYALQIATGARLPWWLGF